MNPILPPDQALKELQPLSITLYEAFPESMETILPYFKERNPPVTVDRMLVNHMVRSEMKRILGSKGIAVEEDDDGVNGDTSELEMISLPQNGLFGSFANYDFRILKSDRGRPPVPGPSTLRQVWYGQQGSLFGFKSEADLRPNVIFLWDFDSNYRSVNLRLACPKQGGKTRSSVATYWNKPVPHPVEMVKGEFSQDATEPKIGAKKPLQTI